MNLFIDFDRKYLVPSIGTRSPLTTLEVKRVPARSFSIQFLSGATATEIDPSPGPAGTIEFGAFVPDDFEGAAILYTNTFSKSGTGASAVYSAEIGFNVAALNDLFIAGSISQTVSNADARHALTDLTAGQIVKQSSDGTYWIVTDPSHLSTDAGWSNDVPEKEFITLAAEVKWTVGGISDVAFTFQLKIWNNYIRTGTVTPPGLLPSQVAPPSTSTDFSVFPGGTAPALGTYFTTDGSYLYCYTAGAASWVRSALATW